MHGLETIKKLNEKACKNAKVDTKKIDIRQALSYVQGVQYDLESKGERLSRQWLDLEKARKLLFDLL